MSQPLLGSVNVFVIRGNKLLLGRRANTGWMDGYLCPTGGHVEPNETPRIALVREISEELGTQVRIDDLEFLCVAARKSAAAEYVAYEFVVRDKDYTFVNNEKHKCSELVWVDLDALPDDIIPDFREIVENAILGDQTYFEIGYPRT